MTKLSRTYRKWQNMVRRCHSPKAHNWKYYGARGIQVCDRWREPKGQGFRNFLADMGEAPPDLTLGRIDNNLGYSKDNCRWETMAEQSKNRRKRPFVAGSLRDKARSAGLHHMLVYHRIHSLKWSEEKALSTPKHETKPHKKRIVCGLMAKARSAGLPYNVVYARIHSLKWSEEEALRKPVKFWGTPI